jgi:hypothetical protein
MSVCYSAMLLGGTAVRPRCGNIGKQQGREIHRGDGIWHGCLSAGAVGYGGPILCVYVRFGLACLLACWCVGGWVGGCGECGVVGAGWFALGDTALHLPAST